MKINIRTLSENPRRVRLIPKGYNTVSANVGVDNPTLQVDEDYTISFCLAKPPIELSTSDALFLEYVNNPTVTYLRSKISIEFNGKVYTGYWLNYSSEIRSPLISLLQGAFTAADGEVVYPIGTQIAYNDTYANRRSFRMKDDSGTGNITISGFDDNTIFPGLVFAAEPATLKFVLTPENSAPPPQDPEEPWVDLIQYFGAPQVGTIHFGDVLKSAGTLRYVS